MMVSLAFLHIGQILFSSSSRLSMRRMKFDIFAGLLQIKFQMIRQGQFVFQAGGMFLTNLQLFHFVMQMIFRKMRQAKLSSRVKRELFRWLTTSTMGLISLAIRICLLQKYIRYYMHFGFLQLFAHRRFCQKKNILYCQRFLLNVTHTILVTMVQRDFGLCS